MNREQCRRCIYYKQLSSVKISYACHFMLDTGHPRAHDGDKCLSRVTKKKRVTRKGFDAPLPQQ